ncbi:unnamed protein product, partial [Mycena citricolor]
DEAVSLRLVCGGLLRWLLCRLTVLQKLSMTHLPDSTDLGLLHELERSLRHSRRALKRRLHISADRWEARSDSSRTRFFDRLRVLSTTLSRLRQFCVEHHLRVTELKQVRATLERYLSKLASLMLKIDATFDSLSVGEYQKSDTRIHRRIQEYVDERKQAARLSRDQWLMQYDRTL